MQNQQFNVLCVTKRNDEMESWHEPIEGNAEVRVVFIDNLGLQIAKTVVFFQGQEYDLSHVREGLRGTAVTIGIKNNSQHPYDIWELYTDTPVPGSSSSNPDKIREIATEEIQKYSYKY